MDSWEIAVLIAVGVLCVVSIYLIKTLKKLTEAVDRIDKLVDNNTENIQNIISDLNTITNETKEMTLAITNSVKNADNTISLPSKDDGILSLVGTAKKLINYASVAVAIGKFFSKNKKKEKK